MSQNLGRYILERSIAVGGMGEVFYARQTGPDGFDRTCVVKTMHSTLANEPEIVEMFLEEARLTARLTHPHVAQVYDFGKIEAAYYLAMEWVDGPSLHAVVKAFAMRAQRLPVAPVLRIVSQAAQALEYVHKLKGSDGEPLKLVHRDISPGNLLLSKDGLVKLIDFGIAKARTTNRQTKLGQIRGKLAYMSPEQMLGMPLDGRTDIYSLGLVLYELLSGRRANPGRNEVEILSSVKTGTLQPLRSLRDDCPQSLVKVLERATARDRDQRFQRAGELAQALEQVIVELGLAVGPQDLTAIAEEASLHPPQPSPAPMMTPRRPQPARAGPSGTAVAAGAPPPPPTQTGTQRTGAGPGRLPLMLGAAALLAIGGGVGVLATARNDKPVQPPQVVATVPPLSEPQKVEPPKPVEPVKAEPAVDPAPVAAPIAAAAPAPKKSRWAKGEKFEKDPPPDRLEKPVRAGGPTGSVQLNSEPATEVWVDGKRAGVTPATLQLPQGAHKVELREPRLGLRWTKSVDVDPATPQSLQWTAEHGTIDVRPVPPHVELLISVDGVSVGPTPISAFSVWEGSRKISAFNTSTGWQTEKSVDVPPGGRVRIKVNDGTGMEVTK